jgi:hypothetical protein
MVVLGEPCRVFVFFSLWRVERSCFREGFRLNLQRGKCAVCVTTFVQLAYSA